MREFGDTALVVITEADGAARPLGLDPKVFTVGDVALVASDESRAGG